MASPTGRSPVASDGMLTTRPSAYMVVEPPPSRLTASHRPRAAATAALSAMARDVAAEVERGGPLEACAEALVAGEAIGRLGVPVLLYGALAGGRACRMRPARG